MANKSAYFAETKAPLEIKEAPIPTPGDDDIIVENAFAGVNPVDMFVLAANPLGFKFPVTMGEDGAGTVTAVGKNVRRFKKGDRVAYYGIGIFFGDTTCSSYQLYSKIREDLAFKVPLSVSLDRAASIPVGFATAIYGLYSEQALNLPLPGASVEPKDDVVIVYGGSSCCGMFAIQVAKQAGYKVLTYASARHREWLTGLGAFAVIDYKDANKAVQETREALGGQKIAFAFDAISHPDSTSILKQFVPANKITTTLPTGFKDESGPSTDIQSANCFNEPKLAPFTSKYLETLLEEGRLVPMNTDIRKGGLEKLEEVFKSYNASGKKVVLELV